MTVCHGALLQPLYKQKHNQAHTVHAVCTSNKQMHAHTCVAHCEGRRTIITRVPLSIQGAQEGRVLLVKVLFCPEAGCYSKNDDGALHFDVNKDRYWILVPLHYLPLFSHLSFLGSSSLPSLFFSYIFLHLIYPSTSSSSPSLPHHSTTPAPSCRSASFLLPLSSPVQWLFSDAVIHSCSRHSLMVM